MSYDHLLFRRSTTADATTGGSEDDLVSLGTPAEVEAMLRGVLRVVDARGTRPGSEPEWSVESLTGGGVYAIAPSLAENGEVHMLTLRGAWREDAVHLARALEASAYDPQCWEEVYPYQLQTLRIALPSDRPLTLRRYRGLAVVDEFPLPSDGELFHRLNQWCVSHQDGWHPAQVSYTRLQPDVEVSEGIFGLKLAGARAVVYGWSACGPFEREVDPASYQFLLDGEESA